jgi:hypothetical protein
MPSNQTRDYPEIYHPPRFVRRIISKINSRFQLTTYSCFLDIILFGGLNIQQIESSIDDHVTRG